MSPGELSRLRVDHVNVHAKKRGGGGGGVDGRRNGPEVTTGALSIEVLLRYTYKTGPGC